MAGSWDAVVLDLGNVVIEIDFARVFRAWSTASGRPAEAIAAGWGFDDAHAAFETGRLDADGYFAHVDASLRLDLPIDAIAAGWAEIFVGPYPDVVAQLPAVAARLPLALFTNTNEPHVAVWSQRYAAALQPFHHQFISSRIGRRKPDPVAFTWIARELGVAPPRILFLDDHPPNVDGARAAGLDAHCVGSPAQTCRWLAQVLQPAG